MRPAALRLALGMLVLGLVAFLTIFYISPPAVRGADAPPTEFSATRAATHLGVIAKSPHPSGSPAHDQVRAYLQRTLGSLGLEVRVEETDVALLVAGTTHAGHIKNVIARLPGTSTGAPAVLLAAHYDSVPGSRGASDDGSGVATLLETARALVAGARLKNDILFLFTDSEENAMLGAVAFTRDELQAHPVGVAMNFEARGTRGAVALYDTSEANASLVQALRAAPRIVSTSLLGSLAKILPNDSDATLWKRAGIPAYAFAYVDHFYEYHAYTDSLDALDPRSLQHDGDYALPLARFFGDADLPLAATGGVVYFDVLGRFVVSYSTLVARIFALLTLGAFVALVRNSRQRVGLSPSRSLLGALIGCGAVVVALLGSLAVHLLLRKVVDPFVLGAHPGVASIAGLVLGLAAFVLVVARVCRAGTASVTHMAFGGLGLFLFGLLTSAVIAPGASFIFQWPLLAALAGTWGWVSSRDQPEDARVPLLVTGALVPATFFWSYVAYTMFVMMGPQVPELLTVAVAIPLLLAIPVLALVGPDHLGRAARVGAAVSAAILAAGGFTLRSSPGVPRPDLLEYTFDPTHKTARWSTNAEDHDAFVTQRIPAGALTAKADLYDVAPPKVATTAVDEGDLRHGTLTITSQDGARCTRFWEVSKQPVVKARVDDRDVETLIRFSPDLDEKLMRLWSGPGPQAGWVMQHCGSAKIKLDLFVPKGQPIKLRIIETKDGLPGPALVPRGPDDGYAEFDGDVTNVLFDVKL